MINTVTKGSGTIWLDDVSCKGNENYLHECEHSDWGKHNCLHTEDVSVACTTEYSNTPSKGQ